MDPKETFVVRYDIPIGACIRRGAPNGSMRWHPQRGVTVEQLVRWYLTTVQKKGKTHLPQTRAPRVVPGVSPD